MELSEGILNLPHKYVALHLLQHCMSFNKVQYWARTAPRAFVDSLLTKQREKHLVSYPLHFIGGLERTEIGCLTATRPLIALRLCYRKEKLQQIRSGQQYCFIRKPFSKKDLESFVAPSDRTIPEGLSRSVVERPKLAAIFQSWELPKDIFEISLFFYPILILVRWDSNPGV